MSLAFLAALFALPSNAQSENCSLTISGWVQDVGTGHPISYANIFVKELKTGVVSDAEGLFQLKDMCPGAYHLVVSHIGCKTREVFLNLTTDTALTIAMDHGSRLLGEVAVVGEGGRTATAESQSLGSEIIAENAEKNLATMLESIPGVRTMRNGSGIAKPVVQGLHGSRLTILNNGIAQSGQQWGADHSPEIDPLVANRITVVKGVGAVEYPGSALGGVILVEPRGIEREPHLHGEGSYFFESNGRGHGLNLEMRQYSDVVAWRVVGTLKKSGDKRSPDYFLRNTGGEEANLALQVEKEWNEKWSSELYFSTFNARLGVLRGAHIGNLTDLEDALSRKIPFFTQDEFSYDIHAPHQQVNHHLLKFRTKYILNGRQWVEVTYAGQYNLRKEFDVRRSGRSDIPALSLRQITHFAEGKYHGFFPNDWELKTGVQLNRVDNANLPETGILPLIPDYISHTAGVFGTLRKSFAKTTVEVGARHEIARRNVAAISVYLPREIVRFGEVNHNTALMAGVTQNLGERWNAAYNIGLATRSPDVNELYSNGLHQGVSGIELGDPTLKREISAMNTLSIKGQAWERLFFEGLIHYRRIDDYIFLRPAEEMRLTIRGAFPVFRYEQTDARLVGFDLAATFKASERLGFTGKYSFLDGQDRTRHRPLVHMPGNSIFLSANHQSPSIGRFRNIEFEIDGRYVFEQKNLLPDQDFVAPPQAYFLLGARVSAERQLQKLRLNLYVKAENLLDQAYRDYLNRQRYFADDLGFNLIAGVRISF